MSEFSLSLVTPQQDRLLHVVRDARFLFWVFDCLVVVREMEDDFAMVVDEPGTPSLEKERTNPCVLPVNYVRDVTVLGEQIIRSYVPVPDGRPAEMGGPWREM